MIGRGNAPSLLVLLILGVLLAGLVTFVQPAEKPAPTLADVRYGPHERNVLDFWRAESTEPAPLVVYIHGGGFRGGSKESLNADTLKELLAAGISVAAVHYRLVPAAPLPAAHQDARRALQFLRFKAAEWNIDKKRVGAFGGSAGAQICMWLAFHDEMADPQSADPMERESTRLACVATNGGQTTLDFEWWRKWIPGYDSLHRDPSELFGNRSKEEVHKLISEISALSLVTRDDPPIFMSYAMAPGDSLPSDPGRAQNWKVHHVIFGIKLKEKMDTIGVEADLRYPGASSTYQSIAHFFRVRMGKPHASLRDQVAKALATGSQGRSSCPVPDFFTSVLTQGWPIALSLPKP